MAQEYLYGMPSLWMGPIFLNSLLTSNYPKWYNLSNLDKGRVPQVKISKVKAIAMIRGSKGKVFTVTFTKRTNGDVRKLPKAEE